MLDLRCSGTKSSNLGAALKKPPRRKDRSFFACPKQARDRGVKITIEVMPGLVIKNQPPSNALTVHLDDPLDARRTLSSVGLNVVEIDGRMWLDISGFTGTISVTDKQAD